MLFHMGASGVSRMGFVLAGGKSSRMGRDKAFLEFEGQTLLERALDALAGVSQRVAIVGNAEKFAIHGTVIEDIFPGCGPLGGIHAALVESKARLNLMLAVDMPFAGRELLTFLFSEAEKTDAVVTVPRTSRGLQPLCAVYRGEFAAAAEQALKAGEYKVDAAFAGLRVRVVEESELIAAGFGERSFLNVNSPEDLETVGGGRG